MTAEAGACNESHSLYATNSVDLPDSWTVTDRLGQLDQIFSAHTIAAPLVAQSTTLPTAPLVAQLESMSPAPTTKYAENTHCAQDCATSGAVIATPTKSATYNKRPRNKKPTKSLGAVTHKQRQKSHTSPPSIAGHEWRFTGTGWSLFKRKMTRTEDGRRISERTYLRWYTTEAIERMRNARKEPETSHARRTRKSTRSSSVARSRGTGRARSATSGARGQRSDQ